MESMGAETASLMSVTAGPLLGILIALFVLGQFPTSRILAGGALLILGASLVVIKPGRHHHILSSAK
jgi:drug/metabolite transporter (DMT)-like permease